MVRIKKIWITPFDLVCVLAFKVIAHFQDIVDQWQVSCYLLTGRYHYLDFFLSAERKDFLEYHNRRLQDIPSMCLGSDSPLQDDVDLPATGRSQGGPIHFHCSNKSPVCSLSVALALGTFGVGQCAIVNGPDLAAGYFTCIGRECKCNT